MVKYFAILSDFFSLFSPKIVPSLKYYLVHIISGYVSVRTTVLANDTVVARMSKLVEEASSRKSRAQRFIDNFAKYYIPGKHEVYFVPPSSLRYLHIVHFGFRWGLHAFVFKRCIGRLREVVYINYHWSRSMYLKPSNR